MKKLLLTLSLVVATVTGFAQGTVTFANNVAFGTPAGGPFNDRLVHDMAGAPLVGVNWVAQLWYANGAGVAEGSLASLGGTQAFRAVGTTLPGTWSTAGGTSRTLTATAESQTATLQVRVWDGALFANYAAALAGGGVYGKSPTFNYTVPPSSPPPGASAFFMEGLQGFQLVPEPSVIALGVLGAAALLLRRRR